MRPSQASAGGTADPIRLLVINPNSNQAITAQIRDLALRTLGPETEAVVVDLPAAPLAIQSPADRAIAEPLAIARIEQAVLEGFHGAVLACFDDIAITARGRLPIPIIDAVDASLTIARTCARRYTIVTTFEAAVPRIRDLVSRHGLGAACTVRAAGIGGSATARLSPDTLAQLRVTVEAAMREDTAEAIILGSGALAGRAAVLAGGLDLVVIDSIEAAIRLAALSAAISSRHRAYIGPVVG
jgi:allantoin racemase